MFAASFSAYPLTFSHAGTAEAPQGAADVIDVKGPEGSNFAVRLFKMVPAGEVEKVGRGQYIHPDNRYLVTPRNFGNTITRNRKTQ